LTEVGRGESGIDRLLDVESGGDRFLRGDEGRSLDFGDVLSDGADDRCRFELDDGRIRDRFNLGRGRSSSRKYGGSFRD